jgi:hypothetical protein
MSKQDLKDCTFIIPVKIDSYDREQNFKFVIDYLTKNFDTNIVITETSNNEELVLNKKYGNLIKDNNIILIEKPKEKTFHRTRYLNEMLKQVTTSVTVNYDIDVFIPKNNYLKAFNLIMEDNFDLVYPYDRGWYQFMVHQDYRDEILEKKCKEIDIKKLTRYTSEFGHLQFFKTETYKKGYGENEGFIAYGPEDKERYNRFKLLDFNVIHMSDCPVFHLEHYRGKDSGHHENYENNEILWEKLGKMSKEETKEYYRKQSYITKL